MGTRGEEEGKRGGEGLGIDSLSALDLCTKLLLLLDLILSIQLTISIKLYRTLLSREAAGLVYRIPSLA